MRVVVAGLGDVGGRAAAALAAAGHEVVGVRRSSTDGPAGVTMVRGDLRDPGLAGRLPDEVDALVVSVSADGRDPELYRAAYVEGPTTLLDGLLARGDRPRVVYTSSSAVFGQQDGEWVDESSPTEPASATARVLVEAELALAERPTTVTRLRLTGIYGPGRTRLVRLVRGGEATVASRPSWTNRIHAADAASAVIHLLGVADPPPVVIGTDDEPVDRAEVLRWLADRLGVPHPRVDDEAAPDRADKRCSNALLRSLGWEPRYPTFREGYAELLDEVAGPTA